MKAHSLYIFQMFHVSVMSVKLKPVSATMSHPGHTPQPSPSLPAAPFFLTSPPCPVIVSQSAACQAIIPSTGCNGIICVSSILATHPNLQDPLSHSKSPETHACQSVCGLTPPLP